MLKRGFLNSRRQKSSATKEKRNAVRSSPESHKKLSSPPDVSAEMIKTLDPSVVSLELTVELELVEEMTNVRRTLRIPHEIVFVILTRLPAKSVTRFRCVSKVWNSTISDRRFVKSHHLRSSTRSDGTTLLITFPEGGKSVRSVYAVVDKRENEEGPDVVYQLNLPVHLANYISTSINGLFCLEEDKFIKVCNPTTRQFITLPRTEQGRTPMDPWTGHLHVTSFGYDSINDQHKVLNTKFVQFNGIRMITEHRVFVLGSSQSQSSWRRLVDSPPHLPRKKDGVCLNDVIYYRAWTKIVNQRPQGGEVLVEFDIRHETFRYIQLPDGALSLKEDTSACIQSDGHLAVVDYEYLKGRNTMSIWVLEDARKPDWVHKTIVFSSAAGWTDSSEDNEFFVAGTNRIGEVIIAPYTLEKPFYLFFLDLKKAGVRRVEICSLSGSWLRLSGVFCNVTVMDHVESILTLKGR